jgi:hypothetical protein
MNLLCFIVLIALLIGIAYQRDKEHDEEVERQTREKMLREQQL